MTSLLNEVRKGEYPKFYLLHGRLTPEEMHCVYKNPKIKGMVSATRGEGFGLPFLEAAVSDLPILATDWSGHLDFLNKGKFIKFNYDLKEVHESKIDNHIFIKDTKWAEVREDDFKSKVRKFREKSDKPKQWAVELGENLRNSHSQSAISDIYEEVFGTIL
jgi:glycosyltransferase involved in cell wall biosynthesis